MTNETSPLLCLEKLAIFFPKRSNEKRYHTCKIWMNTKLWCDFIKAHRLYVLLWFCECCISVIFSHVFYTVVTDFIHVQMHVYHHLFIACESWLCGLQIETLMETTISLTKNTPHDDFEISKFCGGAQSQTQLKRGVTFCCWYSRLLYSNLLASSFFYWNPCINAWITSLGTILFQNRVKEKMISVASSRKELKNAAEHGVL